MTSTRQSSVFSQVVDVRKNPHLSRHTKCSLLKRTNDEIKTEHLLMQDYFGQHYILRRDRQLIRNELGIILSEGALKPHEQASIRRLMQLLDEPSTMHEFLTPHDRKELGDLLKKGKTVALSQLEQLYEHEMEKRTLFFERVSELIRQRHLLGEQHCFNLNHHSHRVTFLALIERMLRYLMPNANDQHHTTDWFGGYVFQFWDACEKLFTQCSGVDYELRIEYLSKHQMQQFLLALRELLHQELRREDSPLEYDDVRALEEVAFFVEEDVWAAFVADETNDE